ncbi:DUF4249 domain-containing protein [Flavobacteriaceae bacterium F08102]|nr:DUF4249 domain-containing protein [Flavobacteriaceae bacterium F08102]
MKIVIKYLLICHVLMLAACQDVIDLTVPTEPARLVIEGSINWEKNTRGNEQTIKLSMSTPYFETNRTSVVTGADVKIIKNDDGTTFNFVDQGDGLYTTDVFVPEMNQSYTLEVRYEGALYVATETMTAVADIDAVNQSIENGFDKDELEVNIFFTDPLEEGNSYLFKFYRQGDLLPELAYFNDDYVNGNDISWWYEKQEDAETDKREAFAPGDIIEIELYGISKSYYDYISILIDQYWNGGGPFGVTPVGLKGNCINTSNPDKPAYGYFRLSEVVRRQYTFE